MCVYSSVRDTLTLLSQVGRQVFTSRSSFLSTNCWVLLLPWKQEKKKQHKQKSWFLIYLWRMSTSHLYAHLFIDMCTMDWMLKALEHWRLVSELWDGLDVFPDVGLSAWPAAPPAASLDLLCCVAATLHRHPSISPHWSLHVLRAQSRGEAPPPSGSVLVPTINEEKACLDPRRVRGQSGLFELCTMENALFPR